MKELKGMCAALCTPFSEDVEQVDETALRNHIDSMLEAGVHSIPVNGGTGELPTLPVRSAVDLQSLHQNI